MKGIGLLIMLMSAIVAIAGECQSDPKLVGACFVVHGRMYTPTQGGAVTRIWRIGTRRIMAVTEHDLPPNVDLVADSVDEIVANFLVCPLTKLESGVMQHVCVESATHVRHVAGKSAPN